MSLKGHQLEVLWSRPLPTPELCKPADAARLSAPPCWRERFGEGALATPAAGLAASHAA